MPSVPFGFVKDLALPLCLTINLAFWFWCGWRDAALRVRPNDETRQASVKHAIAFTLIQILAVPLIGGVVAFGGCVVWWLSNAGNAR